MEARVSKWSAQWKADKLRGSLIIFWLAAVAASFWGQFLFPVAVPALGTMYLFRILLPITAILYVVWAVREREPVWKGSSAVEKWCLVLIVVTLLYGVASLPRALDFMHTFRMLFNLCFDLCFFFLMLRLCRSEKLLCATLWVAMGSVALLCVLGIYEVFCGGIFFYGENDYPRFFFFNVLGQAPVVASGNTNDYASTLVFTAISWIALLIKSSAAREKHSKKLWLLPFIIPVLYFLLLATASSLVLCGFYILLVGILLCFLVGDRRRLLILILSLVLVGGVWFSNQYHYMVPSIQQYLAELQEYRQQNTDAPGTSAPGGKPSLVIEKPNQVPLEDEFFTVNSDTGEKELREDGTGGVRARLLLHTFWCFKESRGLGVGLGNTEMLTQQRAVIQDGRAWSIHCFIARILADFGVFVLLPLCAIVFLLLKRLFAMLISGLREKNTAAVGYALFCFCVLCAYPFVSTASSDAQDIIAMWLYFGAVVLLCGIQSPVKEEICV